MQSPAERRRPRLLITDLDNTLWDWFAVWHASFSAMLDRLVELSGVPRQVLEDEIRTVHQARGTTEYSYLLNELPSLREVVGDGVEPLKHFDEAVHVLNKVRSERMRLYPGVADTLAAIRARGVPVVAYSESLAYWTEWRIRRTRLDGVIDVLYTSPDHDFPTGVTAESIRKLPSDRYGLKVTKHKHVERGLLKPNSKVLDAILAEFGVAPSDAVYVGDSLMKDVAMAQQVGVVDVHAAYGVAQDRDGYDLLRRVSHWTRADVERERRIHAGREVDPAFTLRNGFGEISDGASGSWP